LTPTHIQSAFDRSSQFAYQPKPKMVYITNATEVGTVYTRSELEAIAAICKKLDLILLMDGARLGAALASKKNDMTLLRDDLFLRLAKHANEAAEEMSASLVEMGYKLWSEAESNQVFVIFSGALVRELKERYDFFVWEDLGDGSKVVRLVTSWATVESEVKRFCGFVKEWTDRAAL